MPSTPRPKWQRKKAIRPQSILDAALLLFINKGFRSTKIEDIAKAAGLTKGAIYLYYDSKETILKAVVEETLVQQIQRLEEERQEHTGTVSALLHQLMTLWWNNVGKTPLAGLCKLMMAETHNFPDLARFYHESVILRIHHILATVLQEGIEKQEFRAVSLYSAIDAIVAPLLLNMLWLHSFAQIPQCTVVDKGDLGTHLSQTLDLILIGLQTAPPTSLSSSELHHDF